MNVAENPASHRDVAPLVIATAENVTDMLRRSAIWSRMNDGSLPFAGRASYLEQHWEGLRVLLGAVESCEGQANVVELRERLRQTVDTMGDALDRSHATARWREHHVTMPSMLQFRRRVAEMVEHADLTGIVAHSVVRLAAVGACPVPAAGVMSIPTVTLIRDEEQEELFAEELSAALILMMAHGSDVVRAYQGQKQESTCAVTAATIRNALRR